jgi:hypothetical protein
MAVRLFSLHNVPDDEAEEVRELLRSHAIDFYETPAGNWGVSLPAIWLHDDRHFAQARGLIDQYQQERQLRVRQEYLELKRAGRQRKLIDVIRDNPLRFIVYLTAIAVIVYFSTQPFLSLG